MLLSSPLVAPAIEVLGNNHSKSETCLLSQPTEQQQRHSLGNLAFTVPPTVL
jgi:hypothetical protein